MTYEEAADILDPETRIETLVEIGYYNGFNSDKAQSDAVNEACRIAADVLRNVPDTNVGDKWISVKDRLPENPKPVLVYRHRIKKFMFAEYLDGALYSGGSILARNAITYWMSLPEPPVKGE